MNPQVPNPNRVLVIDDSDSIHKLVIARLRPDLPVVVHLS